MNINYFIFFVGIIIHIICPQFTPLYYLLWNTMIMFFIDVLIPLPYDQVANAGTSSMNFIWLCGVITSIIRFKSYSPTNKRVIIYMLLFLLYILLLGIGRGVLLSTQSFVREFFTFVPLWLIINYKNVNYDVYKKYIFLAFFFEILLVCFQFLSGIYPNYTTGEYAENGAVNIVGTLTRYNAFADIISLLMFSILFICSRNQAHYNYIKLTFICGLCFFLVFASGARTELIAIFVGIIFLFLYKNKFSVKHFWGYAVVILIIGFLAFNYSPSQSIQIGSEENNKRQAELFDFANGERDLSEGSTLSFSVLLLMSYFSEPENFLIGPGKLFTSPNGYYGIITSTEARWDSFNALLLCETGLIGVGFLAVFLFLIVKQSLERRMTVSMLLYLLLVSLTDYGLYSGSSAIFLLFVVYYSNSYYCSKINNRRVFI